MTGGSLQELFEGRIDFEGQQFTNVLVRNLLVGSAALAFILGFIAQSLQVTFTVVGLSTVFLFLAVVPPWPMYNKYPVKWLPAKNVPKKD